MTDDYNPRAFSVLGYRDPFAAPNARPDFAAYSPSRDAAKADRDAYAKDRPDLRLWRIVPETTPERTKAAQDNAVALALDAERKRRAAVGMPPVPKAMTDLMRVPRIPRRRRP